MRGIHPKSFGLGVASGVVVLLLIAGGMHLLQPRRGGLGGPGGGTFQQGGAPNLARMAQRFGMTEDELSKEIASGKTMQQIAIEHGVDMSAGFGGRGPRDGSGAMLQSSAASAVSGSGNAMSVPSAATSSSSSSSATR